jgi:hypothetical protein
MKYTPVDNSPKAKALKTRATIIGCLHTIANHPETEYFWREVDQLTVDKLVEDLWRLAKLEGLTPHACTDHYCICHVWIAEGQTEEYSAGPL